MTAFGEFRSPFPAVVGRISHSVTASAPEDTILIARGQVPSGCDLSPFGAILTDQNLDGLPGRWKAGHYKSLDHLADGDIVLVDGASGRTRTLYRAGSLHNTLFVTGRCNSNCLMCSQPPESTDDGQIQVAMKVLSLLKSAAPARLGISGGEPTLLGAGFIELLSALAADLPTTTITCLSNGRNFADPALAKAAASVAHPNIRFSIPVHADVPDVHDYIAQARGAFRETIAGFYNLEEHGIPAEVRVVLHRQSVPRLPHLSEFVWRKLPFARQVAFMGLENMGYVKKNWKELWIDPIDYADILANAVDHLHRRGIPVSIYNLPYCVLRQDVWGFARQSISDHKQTLIEECSRCDVADHCAGFFTSSLERHSRAIRPIRIGGSFEGVDRGLALSPVA